MDVLSSNFDFTKIELNEYENRHVNIASIITHFPNCKEPYLLQRLLNPVGTETDIHSDFLTWLDSDEITEEENWRLVDIRGRRDPSKAHYTDFCLDGYFGNGVHQGTVALVCELPENLYCKENDCFQHCCQRGDFFDIDKEICDGVPDNLLEAWQNEFNDNLPQKDLNFQNVTNLYGQDPNNPGISCDDDDQPIEHDFTETSVKYLSNGKVDVDGALIPFGKHCYNHAGK